MAIIDFNEGAVLLIDKQSNWTSFDVVKKLKFALKVKKIGHAGTLDPLATGLLVICTGKFTKKIDQYQNDTKEYICEMVFGASTPSFDLETEIDATFPFEHIDLESINNILPQFLGEIEQMPPVFSALKVDGKRAYDLARKGKEVELKSRNITIYSIEILDFTLPKLVIKVVCSKGTYIRSLVRDFGKLLGSGAYMSNLRRTKIGVFEVNDALDVHQYIAQYQQDNIKVDAAN